MKAFLVTAVLRFLRGKMRTHPLYKRAMAIVGVLAIIIVGLIALLGYALFALFSRN